MSTPYHENQASPVKRYNDRKRETLLDPDMFSRVCLVGECKEYKANLTMAGVHKVVIEKFEKLSTIYR